MHKYIFTLGLILTSIYTTTAMADWPETAVKLATDVWTSSSHITPAEMYCADCCKTNCWLPSGTYYDSMGKFTENCGDEPNPPSCISGATYGFVTAPGPSGEQICMPTSCPAGYFLPAALSGCSSCPQNYYCPAGSVSVTPCTNAPANAQYTDTKVETSDCPWKCKDGYKLSGNACVSECNGYKIGTGSFACVSSSINGSAMSYINFDGTKTNSTPALNSNGTWGVRFSYGDVKGEAKCNNDTVPGYPTGTTNMHCWCRMTTPSTSEWIHHSYMSSSSSPCSGYCVSACANSVNTSSGTRESLYKTVQ